MICSAGALKCQQTTFPQSADVCGNALDDDCDGTVDENPDEDGDKFGVCDGDCCDKAGTCGTTPGLINPGAYEVAGNSVDDDCDGVVDNPITLCDSGLASSSSSPADYAKAIDICQTTTENPPLAQKKWGFISGGFHRANGAGTPNVNSRSIRPSFGSNVPPLLGQSFALLSTGRAAAPSQTNPSYASFQEGQDMATSSPAPADWLAANGGTFPNSPGCPAPGGGTTANDPVMLRLRIRVPTNAKSFQVSSFFYSAEYPEWVCSPFNDFFLTLLDSSFTPGAGEQPNPTDKNLAFWDAPPAGGPIYPVGVNLAYGNTGLFRVCKNGQTGCAPGSVLGNTSACTGTSQLVGTGFDLSGGSYSCGTNNQLGGGTGWLNMSGNVKPGETIELRFVIWDTGDHFWDSLVVLDRFQWSVNASQPGTTPN